MSATETLNYLPIERLRELGPAAADRFRAAHPFPHIVFDNLFDPELLHRVIAEFPAPDSIEWKKFKNQRSIKLASNRPDHFGPVTRTLLHHLNSAPFLDFLSQVTGIENLVADSYFDGGGMHQIESGGRLGIHTDFNRHPGNQLDRRLNALLYLTPDWKPEWGGDLELWDSAMKGCESKVSPLFNRLAIFATTDFSYHGHPDPLGCPPGITRKSLALYYYTNGRPSEEVTETRNSALFKDRPGEAFKDRAGLAKRLAADWLPPAITRMMRR